MLGGVGANMNGLKGNKTRQYQTMFRDGSGAKRKKGVCSAGLT